MFLNRTVLQGGVVSTSPNPQAVGPPLVGCPRLLIQFIRSYPPYRRPFLYPKPEDAPCRGDRDPLTQIHVSIPALSIMLMSTLLVGHLRDFAVLFSLHKAYKVKFSLTATMTYYMKTAASITVLS